MLNPIGKSDWILCGSGQGYAYLHGERDFIRSHFPKNSLGVIVEEQDTELLIFLPGQDKQFFVLRNDILDVDIFKTGDRYDSKICNICFVLKPVSEFARNQTDSQGRPITRPSCNICRQDIDRRSIPSQQKKQAEQVRPPKGSLFRCPICRKMGIVGVNVKVVADHNHYAGKWRGFLCDSCNTGLGRFKNGESYLLNAIAYLKEHES